MNALEHNANKYHLTCLDMAGLFAIMIVALALRTIGVNKAFVYSDECFTWRVCREPTVEMLQRVGADTLPPLHFMLLKPWIAAFGDAPWSLRMPSILAGVLCVPAMYLLVREGCRFLPRCSEAGLLSAGLVAVNAVQITHSRVARPYPLAALLGIAATWLLLRALRPAREAVAESTASSTTCWWFAYGICAGLFCLTHHFALFTLAAHAIVVAGFALRLAVQRRRSALWNLLNGGAWAVVAAAAIYSPWLPVFLAQSRRAQTWFWVPDLSGEETIAMAFQWNVGAPTSLWTAATALLGLAAAAVVTLRRAPLAGWLFMFMLTAPWLLTIAVSNCGGRPLLQERYLLFANAGLLALLGSACAVLNLRASRVAIVGLLALVFLPATADFMASLRNDSPGMLKAAAWLMDHYRDGDVITVSLPQTVNIVKYYAGREGFDVDAKVYLAPTPAGGQPIHSTSLHAEDLLTEGPHTPPAGVKRCWRLETRDIVRRPPEGWKRIEVHEFRGPPGTREVAGSERVWLALLGKE